MGVIADKWEEASRRLRALLTPHLAGGEELTGVVHAHQPKVFSVVFYAVGVTPDRLLLPIDRRQAATGPPVSIPRGEIESASVWGWGGSAADFLSAAASQQLRFGASGRKYKLMALGGNWLEDALSGPTQRAGVEALVAFLLSARR